MVTIAGPRIDKFKEIGTHGLRIQGGYVYEERIRALMQKRGRLVFKEMSENDATIGALLFLVEMMLRAVDWKFIVHDDGDLTDDQIEESITFCEQVYFKDMAQTFDDLLADILTFLVYGWAYFEIVYKLRKGERVDTSLNSNYSDGKFGILKIAPRNQHSLYHWELAPNGEILGMWQQPEFNGPTVFLPIQKCMLFRTKSAGGNPEGKSIIRNTWRAWYYLRNIEQQEAINMERDLNGLPVIRLPSELLASDEAADVAAVNAYIQLGRDIKMNEQSSVIVPSDPWLDAEGNPTNMRKVEFDLMSSNTSRIVDTSKSKQDYKNDIARSILADFIMLGAGKTGGFSVSESKVGMFLTALSGWAENIGATFDRQSINKLWRMNKFDPATQPSLVGTVKKDDAEKLANIADALLRSGAVTPDDDLEAFIRTKVGFPEQVILDTEERVPEDDNE